MKQITTTIKTVWVVTLLMTVSVANSHAQFWKKKINRSISKSELIEKADDAKDKIWIRSIRQLDLSWPQRMNGNPPFEEDEFKWMFPHSGIPSFYIIDKDGTIDQMRDLRDLKYSLKALTISE